jgi:hypothetical protein
MQAAKRTRRDFLTSAAASVGGSGILVSAAQGRLARPEKVEPKSVAAVMTVYRPGSHADVLVGKILEGWKQDGGPGPALKLASMYVDQFPPRDLARTLAARYKVPLFDSIPGALTLGGRGVAVDGVISIGEHGDYPWNEQQQHLYPRRRFFEQITGTLARFGRVVPVFNDKHLGPAWADAKWMYERARELKVPLMAGSSLPLSFRRPDVSIPMGAEVGAAVGVGHAGLDIYGIHALECYQSLVERRRGGERGVHWVQCLRGDALWKALEDGVVAKDVLDAALAVVPHGTDAEMRRDEGAALFLFGYADGFQGAVLMLSKSAHGTAVGWKVRGEARPAASLFEERATPRYPHFAYLLKAIERLMHTGRSAYPLERTLLTSGILDRALTSLHQGQKKLMAPELAIRYQPADYPHAPDPDLNSDPRGG